MVDGKLTCSPWQLQLLLLMMMMMMMMMMMIGMMMQITGLLCKQRDVAISQRPHHASATAGQMVTCDQRRAQSRWVE